MARPLFLCGTLLVPAVPTSFGGSDTGPARTGGLRRVAFRGRPYPPLRPGQVAGVPLRPAPAALGPRLAMILHGPRITLAPLTDADRPGFAAMNADPEVMRHFAAPLTGAESDAFQDRIAQHFSDHGFGFWGIRDRATGRLAGLCGLAQIPWVAPFTPAVEIGWRLVPAFQRQGLAEEAARLALAFGFGPLNLPEIVAFTTPGNLRSLALMARLGMAPAGGFDHPRLPPGHALRPHLLFRLTRPGWIRQRLAPA